MRQTFKVSPMVSETALQDAVILVGGRAGKVVGVNSAKSEITVDLPPNFYELSETAEANGSRVLTERNVEREAAEAEAAAKAEAEAAEAQAQAEREAAEAEAAAARDAAAKAGGAPQS